jgi:hypothetical protein
MVGAHDLVKDRLDDILIILREIKEEMKMDIIFQSIIELDEYKNYFIAEGIDTQKILEKILNIKFNGVLAERSNMIMRKQIVPLLKEELETMF